MSSDYAFKIGDSNYNLINLIQGTQSFSLGDTLHFTWMSLTSCFSFLRSKQDLQESELYKAAGQVVKAASKTFINPAKMQADQIAGCLNNYQTAKTSKPSVQSIKKALQAWNLVHPNTASAKSPTVNTPLLQSTQIEHHPSIQNTAAFNPRPFSRKGNFNSCFINTALQIIFHTPSLRKLVNTDILQRPKEISENFQARQLVQARCRALFRQLESCSPNPGENLLQDLCRLVHDAEVLTNPSASRYNAVAGDSALGLTDALENILRSPSDPSPCSIDSSLLENETKLKQRLEHLNFPSGLEVGNQPNATTQMKDKIIVGEVTYQLHAVLLGGSGHATAAIRSPIGDHFVNIDDVSGCRPLSNNEIVTKLKSGRGWERAYYVKM